MTHYEFLRRSRTATPWRWPDEALLAFSIELAFEAFDRHSQFQVRPMGKGQTDYYSLSFADYGWRVGAWRLLDLLDHYQVKGHVLVNGLAAEQHPETVAAMAQCGHEIAAHGWANDQPLSDLDRDQERDLIRRCTDVLHHAVGTRPVGWTSPGLRRTAYTPELLAAEGYEWFGDDASDDLPFVKQTTSGPLVFIPRNSAFHTDLSNWVGPRGSPDVVWSSFKHSFDALYAEAKAGLVNKTELTLHCHLAGRPTLIPIVRQCLDYVRQHENIWFARRCEIANWTRQISPAAADGLRI